MQELSRDPVFVFSVRGQDGRSWEIRVPWRHAAPPSFEAETLVELLASQTGFRWRDRATDVEAERRWLEELLVEFCDLNPMDRREVSAALAVVSELWNELRGKGY